MSEARCDCCDLPVSMCGKAAEEKQRADAAAEKARLLASGWTAANWPGTCVSCGERYEVGTPIRGSAAGWKASCCATS